MFLISVVVLVSWVYTCVKTDQSIHFMCSLLGILLQILDSRSLRACRTFPVDMSIRELEIRVCI